MATILALRKAEGAEQGSRKERKKELKLKNNLKKPNKHKMLPAVFRLVQPVLLVFLAAAG